MYNIQVARYMNADVEMGVLSIPKLRSWTSVQCVNTGTLQTVDTGSFTHVINKWPTGQHTLIPANQVNVM